MRRIPANHPKCRMLHIRNASRSPNMHFWSRGCSFRTCCVSTTAGVCGNALRNASCDRVLVPRWFNEKVIIWKSTLIACFADKLHTHIPQRNPKSLRLDPFSCSFEFHSKHYILAWWNHCRGMQPIWTSRCFDKIDIRMLLSY
jgi:hypothetical protein